MIFNVCDPGLCGTDGRERHDSYSGALISLRADEASRKSSPTSSRRDVTWQHLKRAHTPINYLRALLRNIGDFSHQVRTRQAAAQQAKRQQREAIEVNNAPSSCAGDVFFGVKR
jgi:hypothetical protein